MSGSSTGTLFRVTSFGESHGEAIGCVVDGCPPGMELSEADIQPDLDRRRPGQSAYVSQRREADCVTILSGVFQGKTTGTPIALLIANTDPKSKDYTAIKDLYRPAHADITYQKKYGLRDYRGGGRASARETAVRVAAGAIARKYLREQFSVKIIAWLAQMGTYTLEFLDETEIDKNPFFCADKEKLPQLQAFIKQLLKQGDSIGAKISFCASNTPAGLGEPVYDRLDADIAKALMSINAVKAVGIGDGFKVVEQKGSEHRDEITQAGFVSNHAGGILGGISSGQELLGSVAIKPTSSIRIPGRTIDTSGAEVQVVTTGRHDPCVGIRAVPIVEAMVALTLMDHCLRHRGQNG